MIILVSILVLALVATAAAVAAPCVIILVIIFLPGNIILLVVVVVIWAMARCKSDYVGLRKTDSSTPRFYTPPIQLLLHPGYGVEVVKALKETGRQES